jgi:hypothetical protein
MANFNWFFQSREQMIVRRDQVRKIWWLVKILEAHLRQFLLGCKCPVSRGIVVQDQDTIYDLPPAFFLQNVFQLHQQRWVRVLLRVDNFSVLKIINEEEAVFIPKNRGENFSSGHLHSEFFGRGPLSRYAATPLIVALFPGHSDITSFRPWSTIATANHLDRAKRKNSKRLTDDWRRRRLWSALKHLETHFTDSLLITKSSLMKYPTRSHEMPSCSAISINPTSGVPRLAREFDE